MNMNNSGIKICQLCAVDFTLKHFLVPLIDRLIIDGHEVICVCSKGQYSEQLKSDGYNIINIEIPRSLNPISLLVSLARLINLFRVEKFHILHVHTPVAAVIARLAGKICNIPIIIYTAHGFYFHDEMHTLKKSIYIFIEWCAGFVTDYMFVQSSEDKVSAQKYNIVGGDRVYTIGNGVSSRKFSPSTFLSGSFVRADLGIPAEAIVVCLIGRQVKEKGIIEFLTAAQLINAENNSIWFVLVGDRLASDHSMNIDAHFARVKSVLKDKLIHLGYRDDIPKILSIVDIFCLPSWREGMPRTIIEAMMMGIPVIATNIRGAREEVVHKKTGLLIPTRSVADLKFAILQLAKSQRLRKIYGKNGRIRALKLYEEKTVIEFQVKLINEFIFDRINKS